MINSNKFVTALFLLAQIISNAYAGRAIIFDDPGLIGFRSGGDISGFYNLENQKFSCSFLFFTNGKELKNGNAERYTVTKLFTFVPSEKSFDFTNRDRTFDIDGSLYRNGNAWTIRTASAQAGCENAMGTFTFDLNDFRSVSYRIQQQIPAIGIALAKRKTNFFDHQGGTYVARKGYLTKWNAVIILQIRDQFSLVRFVDPHTNSENFGRVTTGWVRSSDLADPFPPASKQ